MTDVVVPGRRAAARAAVERGAWDEALRALAALDRLDDPEGLELLATAAYGGGDPERAIGAWEDLHALHLREGRDLDAARAAATVAMFLMMDTGLMAPVRGWLARAERLLAARDETDVHALVAMTRAYERFMCGDLSAASHWAERAVAAGDRLDVVSASTLGRVCGARVRIFDGAVDEGMAVLEEVAVVLLSGEVDPLTTGMVWCELICAMQGLTQYDRAAEWTAAMDARRAAGGFFGGINGRCRVHRAELLRLRGDCADAEEEALRACEELRPWMRREYGWPLTELGTIRLRRGDLEGAEEAFLAAHAHGWDPQPGLALLRLAEGETDAAAAMIRLALEQPSRIPWKERPPVGGLSRAPLLGPQVEIAIADGDLGRATEAATELASVAATWPSLALTAMAATAAARVALAQGDGAEAVGRGRDAVEAWSAVGAPYETSAVRLLLAEALQADGAPGLAQLELEAAARALRRIGAVLLADTADAALDRLAGGAADEPSPTEAAAPVVSVFRVDGDLRRVEFGGVALALRDLKGMRHLARLLVQPGRELHVLDLVGAEEGVAADPGGPGPEHDDLQPVTDGVGPLLDEQARDAYRRRLAEIDEDLAEAESAGDAERAALAHADREFLVSELARAFGLHGRARAAGSAAERARGAVTRSIRYAIARIGEHHPTLADHLTRTVRTGTYCSYDPDPRAPITWEV